MKQFLEHCPTGMVNGGSEHRDASAEHISKAGKGEAYQREKDKLFHGLLNIPRYT